MHTHVYLMCIVVLNCVTVLVHVCMRLYMAVCVTCMCTCVVMCGRTYYIGLDIKKIYK